jgi:hypothetical protein
MSFYNMMNGVNPATFFVLPVLGKHPEEFPRFRDCFILEPEKGRYQIEVLTRTGGGNRDDYQEEHKKLVALPTYVSNTDDEFDSTYAFWVFDIPEEWKEDISAVLSDDDILSVSKAYQQLLRGIYPKLSEKFDHIFGVSSDDE